MGFGCCAREMGMRNGSKKRGRAGWARLEGEEGFCFYFVFLFISKPFQKQFELF
jgi:hypothetical protein